ncbi:MAG: hypothetical protein Q9163_004799 [Psora crenata]
MLLTARKSPRSAPNAHPTPTPLNGTLTQAMANELDMINGSHEGVSEPPPTDSSQPMPDQLVVPKKRHGLTNGTYSQTGSENRSGYHSTTMSSSNDQQVNVLRETVTSTCSRFIADFDGLDESFIQNMAIERFLDYIERQRLTHMPHRGSHWDKVLKWAEYFALQTSGYAKALESFVPDAKAAARLIWIACRALLELGPDNAQALEVTFGVFYQLGLSISLFLRHNKLLSINSHLRGQVGYALNDMLFLVREVSLHYRAVLINDSSGEVCLDFNSLFGQRMKDFGRRKGRIVNTMWEYVLGDEASPNIRTLRKWLSPRDKSLQRLFENRDLAPSPRGEFTCEWFQSQLLAFSRSKEDVLAISGPPGCGKSALCGWIIERLQRPLGRKTHETLTCHIEADVPDETTSLAIAKHLVLQLLEKDIGDQNLYRKTVKAYDIALSGTVSATEDALWECLDVGLDQFKGTDNLMIVVDGLDNVKGGEQKAKAVANHLSSLTSKHDCVQTIIFSSIATLANKGRIRRFEMTPDHTHDDLRSVIDQALQGYKHFRDQNEHAREAVVEKLLHAAHGNFLSAILTVVSLKQETSHEAFMKAVEAAKQVPKSLDETISKLVNTMDFVRSNTAQLLSWMLIAERPLAIAEVKNLLQIDLQKKIIVERKSDIKHDISEILDFLVVIQNGFLRFRHPAVRSYVAKIQAEGKRLRNYQGAQDDLTMRLLLYCKLCLIQPREPVFEGLDKTEMDDLWGRYALLEYGVRNWTLHFRCCSMYKEAGSLPLSSDFKAIFPTSAQMALLEWGCWELETSGFGSVHLHELALRIRESVFTEKHESVLQSLIVCGSIYRKIAKSTESGECFYRASRVGQLILRKNHTVTVTCATTFLNITETVTTTTRTELATRKEEMLRFVIGVFKTQHGKTHDLVIRYYKLLAQLYIDIKEGHNAETVWRELREIIIVRFGKGSEEETSISEQLTVVLKRGDKKADIVEFEKGIFDITSELEVWDMRRIKLTLELAVSYEARGELLMAEEHYIMLWRRLTEHCHHSQHHHGVEIHISTIEVVLEYVRFLRRHHRQEEASNVLICIWTEYEEYDFESEALFLRLKIIGELMRAVSLLSVAVSVLKKCWGWFKSHKKHEYTAMCEVLISETIEEITTTTSTTTVATTTTTTTTTTTETVIKEVFESTLSRSKVTSETISICKSLTAYHMKLEEWSAAIEVTTKSLLLIWRSIVSGGIIALPRDFSLGAIDIAISLALCHDRSYHFHEAEEIYIRLYRACRNSCNIHDERLVRCSGVLIKFYEEHRHWHKMIEIYQELLVEYRTHLGASHSLTIRTLYLLGSLCAAHGHGKAYEYYEEIITTLNSGSHVCHADALDAMFFMCRYYYEAGYWLKLKGVCEVLWKTWKGRHHGHEKFTAEFIELLYLRYRYVLETHEHWEYSFLRELTIEYRNLCLKFFGAAVAITIKASIELAQICIRSEQHLHEAISIYEEVLSQSSTTTTTTTTLISTRTISTIKERLSKAYVSVCSDSSTSTTTIERAITVLLERYESLRQTLSWSHIETLTCLRELVILRMKLKSQESRTIVLNMLLEVTTEIIKRETHSRTLHEAGRILAELYFSCGLVEQGLEMIQEMRLQIMTGTATTHGKFGFSLGKSVGRVAFVFFVTFEQVIRQQVSHSYSEIMADYLTEFILYKTYTHSINSTTDIEAILVHAGKLRTFLVSHSRKAQIEVLEQQTLDFFVKKWPIKARREITLIFHTGLLEEFGKHETRQVSIVEAACISSTARVKHLLEQDRFQDAYEVALYAAEFINRQRAYHQLQNVPYGFKLSALMAGRGLNKPLKANIESKLRENMLELSRRIIREVLQACKDSKLDFVRLKMRELNELVGLLGEQQNLLDLEWILDLLWRSREVQKNWRSDDIIDVGRRLVQARYLNNHKAEATRLCEDICYNLRRVWGDLDPKTLEMSDLLSQLYTSQGHYREAQGVHENILRLVVEGDDGDDRTLDTMDSEVARRHVELLKQSFLRLKGWDKSKDVYRDLIDGLINMPEYKSKPEWKSLQSVDQWNLKEQASEKLGKFTAPENWEFASKQSLSDNGSVKDTTRRPGMAMKRATSNWGVGLIHRFFHGDHDQENGNENGNGTSIKGTKEPKP